MIRMPINSPGAPSSWPLAHQIQRNAQQSMSGYALLRSLQDRSAALAFFDPQYRAVLDKLKYGNEGARQKGRAALRAMSEYEISRFIEEIERVLKPSGHLMFWVDKYIIGESLMRQAPYFRFAELLRVVDVQHWNKGRPGMGKRLRCCSEYCIVAQKPPIKAAGIWTDHRLNDTWTEMADRGVHQHAKPINWTERAIRACTKHGDVVVDPCAGGYGVLDACLASGRIFIGCDIAAGPK